MAIVVNLLSCLTALAQSEHAASIGRGLLIH